MAVSRWVTGGLALGWAVTLLAGCGDDEPTRARPEAGEDLPEAGTELADGLIVPEGARLAGAVFRRPGHAMPDPVPPETVVPSTMASGEGGTIPPETTAGPAATQLPLEVDPEREEWTAVLVVEGDPFAVWDDLAIQVRDVGPELAGSADACLWQVERDPDDPFPPDPYRVVDGEPAEPIDHLRCEAAASDGTRHVSVSLRRGGAHPGTVEITLVPDEGPPFTYAEAATPMIGPSGAGTGTPVTGPTSSVTSQPPDTLPVPGPDSVGPEAHDLLPHPEPSTAPEPGDRFGGEGNCLATGYDRMVLPEGTELVAAVGGPDGTSVLRVDDARAAVDVLLATSGEGDDAESFDVGPVEHLPLADGGTVLAVGFSVSGGGGACDLLASPDGRYVLVTMHSD